MQRLPLTCAFISTLLFSGLFAHAKEQNFAKLIKQRVRDWQPTLAERRFDQIGWADNLVTAKELAKQHQRPVFIFTYNGSKHAVDAIARQRC
jgi:hypothetical protein